MTHPTNTVLTDEEIDAAWAITPNHPDGHEFVDFARHIERAVIERLGASDAVPVAYQFQGLDGWWHNFLNAKHRRETVDAGYAVRPLYDATALAAARRQGRNEGREEGREEFGADRWIDKDQPICVAVLYMEGDDPLIFAVSGRTTVWALETLNADLKDNAGDYFDQGDGDYILSGVWCSDSDGPIGYELDLIRYSPMAARQPTQKDA